MSHLLQVLLLLAIIITASKAAGALSKKLGQPAVFGELLVGLLLGPTLLNILPHEGASVLFPDAHKLAELVKDLAELGVIFLMFLAGLETDLEQMKKVGLAAFLGATGGVFLPLVVGYAISATMFDTFEAIFIGTILTATSVSISAQTLLEMNKLRSKEGTTILGAAVIDDVMGIIVLSLVLALHGGGGGGEGPVWMVLVRMVAFFVGGILIGRLLPRFLKWTEKLPGSEVGFAAAIVIGLVFAFAAEYVGKVAAITGSYLAGVMIAQNEHAKHFVEEKLAVLSYGFFVPIFFVSIGLEANAWDALRPELLGFTLAIVAASVFTKIIGSGLGVKLVGFTWLESLRVGTGMISRGEVALIVAGIGFRAGVIGEDILSAMVLMTLFTTLVTPMLLRVVFGMGEKKAAKA